ncbi:hypothetical protein FOS14_18105 [Skermania sp. ID1734]|uniref:hypothetical protein n=1 Tax=Skermania sp. ID1734 TaxID=2597516 RepID=UPI00117EA61E|nr:hypothetical protein [Skermania sp. ID1734]TSD95279.1 hypothetical protein FOS14_18105 [Skermania sp. ID1734]
MSRGRAPLDPTGAMLLLERVLDQLPALPQAACRGQWQIYEPRSLGEEDECVAERRAAAAQLCGRCPERVRCQWRTEPPGSP